MKRVLIAIDDSASARRAVEYVGQQFGGTGDVEVGLVHVLPNLPPTFWDEGHILSGKEKRDRRQIVAKWLASEMAKMTPVLRDAVALLIGTGFQAAQIRKKSISDSTDVAETILEEARNGGYQTIVLGRRGPSPRHILGTVATKIIHRASGLAVTVVE